MDLEFVICGKNVTVNALANMNIKDNGIKSRIIKPENIAIYNPEDLNKLSELVTINANDQTFDNNDANVKKDNQIDDFTQGEIGDCWLLAYVDKLDNLTIVVDNNNIQALGDTKEILDNIYNFNIK